MPLRNSLHSHEGDLCRLGGGQESRTPGRILVSENLDRDLLRSNCPGLCSWRPAGMVQW